MLGAFAEAEPNSEIQLNDDELEDARWFSRDEIVEALAKEDIGFFAAGDGSLRLPGPYAIAHDLIRAWVDGKHLTAKI